MLDLFLHTCIIAPLSTSGTVYTVFEALEDGRFLFYIGHFSDVKSKGVPGSQAWVCEFHISNNNQQVSI